MTNSSTLCVLLFACAFVLGRIFLQDRGAEGRRLEAAVPFPAALLVHRDDVDAVAAGTPPLEFVGVLSDELRECGHAAAFRRPYSDHRQRRGSEFMNSPSAILSGTSWPAGRILASRTCFR